MSDHSASTPANFKDMRKKSGQKAQKWLDGGNDRAAKWTGGSDDLVQESRPLPPRRIRTAALETPSLTQDINSIPMTLLNPPDQARLRDAQEDTRSSSLNSSRKGLLHDPDTPSAREHSIHASAKSSLLKVLPTRESPAPVDHRGFKSHRSPSGSPVQATKASGHAGSSSSNGESTYFASDGPPKLPQRNPRRLSQGTNGSVYGPNSISQAPMPPSRNPRRGSTNIATALTQTHDDPRLKRPSKGSVRSGSLAVPQKDPQHGTAIHTKQPNATNSTGSMQHGAAYTSNSGPRPTSASRDQYNTGGGLPVSIMGRETDSGGSSTGSVAKSTNPLTTGQKSSGSGGTKSSSDSSTKHLKRALDSSKCIRNDVMVNYLYQQALRRSYVSSLDLWQGIVLKERRGKYSCCPPQLAIFENGLLDNVKMMNVSCAMTVSTPVTRTILESMMYEKLNYVPMPNGLRVQVLKTFSDLPRCQIHHFAAFLEDLMILVVWDDDPEHLLQRAENLEENVVKMIWGDEQDQAAENAKKEDPKAQADDETEVTDPGTLEAGTAGQERRPVRIVSSIIVACTICLAVTCMGFGWRRLAMECKVDKNFVRLALLALAPVQLFFSMFFFQAVCGNIIQMLGPTSQIENNSKYYSGKAPERLKRRDCLPHVTIHMPVFKEGTNAVIRPTVMSLKTAISTYEMQGGTANIFVNDDGMQILSEGEAQERREFYDEHQIGWVARPKHDPHGQRPFLRRGKFKKASNMNYAMSVSRRIEDKLHHISRNEAWTDLEERKEYENALAAVLEEDKGRTWAEGNIRMGDYILLIDCDTRVPKDCFLDGVSEMEQSPQIAIIQFTSGVLNVSTSFFEQGITWFTNLIYTAITYAVSTGDVCPFVGHNALMRWSAIQSAAAFEDEDGYEKYWSESHVSEDFDMAIRLQCGGYSIRYAAYTGEGFKEGVSLTVYDELARWEKYAYGCNELIFHPFRYWLTRSPFTPLFRKFITARRIPLPKKITICSYIGTYYAIASAWLLTVTNYLLSGWGFGLYEKYYADSFSIFFSVVIVFTGLGNVSLAALRYRLKRGSLVGNYLENAKWIPMLTVYLGGVSLHVSQAILSHFFEIEMNWGATSKEVRDARFHEELATVLKKFKGTFLFCLLSTAVILVGYWAVPYQWQIRDFASIFPFAMLVGCHFLLPIVLNPALVKFSW